jgi:hypothetical protein
MLAGVNVVRRRPMYLTSLTLTIFCSHTLIKQQSFRGDNSMYFLWNISIVRSLFSKMGQSPFHKNTFASITNTFVFCVPGVCVCFRISQIRRPKESDFISDFARDQGRARHSTRANIPKTSCTIIFDCFWTEA